MSEYPLTLGTAGHIDHGKSALVRALTGVDTDRLPEERSRGISIELGYARLELPSGRTLSVIDVPGHERYVRTMVAGATGIDLYLMAIAADDGVMPQTREHAAVLRALVISRGVVAITKSDLSDPGRAAAQAVELMPGAEVVPVSVRDGRGLDELRGALARVAATVPGRASAPGPVRLHVDRVFSIRGAGTVVTGTLWSGEVARGDTLELLPGRRRARAREVQVHDQTVERARAGQRVAVNLGGVGIGEVDRGDVLTGSGPGGGGSGPGGGSSGPGGGRSGQGGDRGPRSGDAGGPGTLRETYLVDAALEFEGAEPANDGGRVQVHHGTREAPARLAWLGGPYWQIRLEHALVAAAGDRLVVRGIAPPDTVGGGVVLDAHPRRHGPGREHTARLARLARGEPAEPPPAGAQRVARAPGTRRGPEQDRALPEQPAPTPLPPSALALEERLRAAGLEPPLNSELDAGDLAALRAAGRAVRVGPTLHFHRDALTEATRRVTAAAERSGGAITLSGLRNELGTSRKFAQALLEHLDGERVTIRRGDAHVLRTQGREPL